MTVWAGNGQLLCQQGTLAWHRTVFYSYTAFFWGKYRACRQGRRAAGEFDWEAVFQDASLLHISGITSVISEQAAEVAEYAMKEALGRGIACSLDLNYRAQWKSAEIGRKRLQVHLDRGINPQTILLYSLGILLVRPAAHVSNRCKSGIRPVVGRI